MWKEGRKGKKTSGKQKPKNSHLLGSLLLDATIIVLHH